MFAFYKTWSQCWGSQGISHLIELGLAEKVSTAWMDDSNLSSWAASITVSLVESHAYGSLVCSALRFCLFMKNRVQARPDPVLLVLAALRHAPWHCCIRGRDRVRRRRSRQHRVEVHLDRKYGFYSVIVHTFHSGLLLKNMWKEMCLSFSFYGL